MSKYKSKSVAGFHIELTCNPENGNSQVLINQSILVDTCYYADVALPLYNLITEDSYHLFSAILTTSSWLRRGKLDDTRTIVFMNPHDLARESATSAEYNDYLTIIRTNAPAEFINQMENWCSYHEDYVSRIESEGYFAQIVPKPYEIYEY